MNAATKRRVRAFKRVAASKIHASTPDITLTVTMKVTTPQALTLQAFFEEWNSLGNVGSSRFVAFYADGDGDFHPDCEVSADTPLPELTDELREAARSYGEDVDVSADDIFYDFDGVAWKLTDRKGEL